MMLEFLPLAVVALVALALALAPLTRPGDRVVTHLSLAAFGGWVADRGRRHRERRGLLQSVHLDDTYRMYAAKTLLYSGVAAVVGSVAGVYLVAGVLAVLGIPPETIRATLPTRLWFLADLLVDPDLSVGELFGVLLASSAVLGAAAGGLTYWIRWENLSYRANARERKIDESIARTVAFVYALSRSGMAFPEILRTLARNRSVYGEAAEELSVAAKSMDYAGLDMLSAIERLADRTPSEKFGDFAENLASVLQSGQSIPAYLDDQYERYQEDAEAQQESFLELLATLAEAYVSVFVVAPLLFITILVIMGLMALGDTLSLLRVIVYFALPLANAGFVIYLDSITESLRATREDRDVDLAPGLLSGVRRTDSPDADRDGVERPAASADAAGRGALARSDGGSVTRGESVARDETASHRDNAVAGGVADAPGDPTDPVAGGRPDVDSAAANFERLDAFERVRWLRDLVSDPVRTLRDRPTLVLYALVPLGVLSVAVRAWPHLAAGSLTLRLVDDFVVQAALAVLGGFAVVQELHRRRIAAIEAAVPDFLDRLASVNDAGMSVVESLGRVAGGDLGALDDEIDRVWADVQWGVDAETALYRLEDRVNTPTITRVVTLLGNAMHASGDLAKVLRIAADEAQDTRRLKRKRRQEMLTYVVIIYLSFFVFLVIIGALNSILIPNLPTGGAPDGGGGVGGGPLADIASVNVDAYTLLFFHASLVQAVCSGLLAGQMGETSVRNGAKHATVLLAVAYVAFLVMP
ncbi:type II secretion system F family protein [Halorussus salilacus]|uniref:type II secretion system F family protein n=1 Tax=Halorussus salilacus TaxID=2953750 RepID=UPI0020A081FA|nr:type II secretion system F family protein [Halorussus salilacus]USZ68784.1 type II secretion system F family protein [Halorussus salilacus]